MTIWDKIKMFFEGIWLIMWKSKCKPTDLMDKEDNDDASLPKK